MQPNKGTDHKLVMQRFPLKPLNLTQYTVVIKPANKIGTQTLQSSRKKQGQLYDDHHLQLLRVNL